MRLFLFQILLAALACSCVARFHGPQSPLKASGPSINHESPESADSMKDPSDSEEEIGRATAEYISDLSNFWDSVKLESMIDPDKESHVMLVDFMVAQGLGTAKEIEALLEAQHTKMPDYEAGMTPTEQA